MCLLSASTLFISAFRLLKDGQCSHAGLDQTSAVLQSFKAEKACCKKQFDAASRGVFSLKLFLTALCRTCIAQMEVGPPELSLGPKASKDFIGRVILSNSATAPDWGSRHLM